MGPDFQIQSQVSNTKKEPDLQSVSQPSAFGFSSGRNPIAHSLQWIGWNRGHSDQQRNLYVLWDWSRLQEKKHVAIWGQDWLCQCTNSEIFELIVYTYIFKSFYKFKCPKFLRKGWLARRSSIFTQTVIDTNSPDLAQSEQTMLRMDRKKLLWV